MARDAQEPCLFTTVPTALASESAGLLYVPEKAVKEGSIPPEGTKLKDFMPKANKADAQPRGFGDYVFTQQGDLQDGYRSFWFSKVRSPEEIAVAFRTEDEQRLGVYWPAVLGTVVAGNLLAYLPDGVSTYVASTVWDFVFSKPAYDGPTKVRVEFFASHAPFTIPAAAGMQPMGGVLDYGIGSVTVPECLHGAFTLSYVIPANHPNYPEQSVSKDFAATTPTTRPESFVLRDGYRFENGLYIRRRETAYEP